ncbi:hypothetical protein CSA17_05180 [bacterium DOLJORAL78_65_58]|nr:MAG: hypothetical protein CSB20_13085 [bacterium DOLZORAL124_64_63]PIE75894.1 MAG: hypothetical protein CSA17_05180 [bacterium DOLJORAL78_65_58]
MACLLHGLGILKTISHRTLGRVVLLVALTAVAVLAWHYAPQDSSGLGLLGTLTALALSIGLGWMADLGRWSGRAILPLQMVIDVLAVVLVATFAGQKTSNVILLGVAGTLAEFGLWHYFQRIQGFEDSEQKSRRRVQKALWEMRNIIDNIRSGLLTIDTGGVVVRVNPACCRILEMEESDLIGCRLEDVCRGGMEQMVDVILPVARGEAPVDRGEALIKRMGRELPLGLNVNHVTAPGGRIIGAICIFTDLTREKEMTARVRENDRLAAIGELAASIAHEIRNPLASIRGSVEMLADDLDLEGDHAALMTLILKESSRVNTIINDFLAYSRMRPTNRRRFRAREFGDEISLQIRQHVAAKNGRVNLHCDVQPEDMELVADPGQLTQLTLNLVINACEAMHYQGDLGLNLRLLAAGTSQELVITDDGPGIDEDIRQDMFTPFATNKEGGTGLGLAIVQRIAAAHGGRVRAEDRPGGGTVFRVRWPVVHVPELGQDGPRATDRPSAEAAEPEQAEALLV